MNMSLAPGGGDDDAGTVPGLRIRHYYHPPRHRSRRLSTPDRSLTWGGQRAVRFFSPAGRGMVALIASFQASAATSPSAAEARALIVWIAIRGFTGGPPAGRGRPGRGTATAPP